MKRVIFFVLVLAAFANLSATSQWSRKFGMSCTACHTVFPRLNSFGEEFLKNGYQLMNTYKKDYTEAYPVKAGDVLLDEVGNIFGFRLNITPFRLETNALLKDSKSERSTKITFGEANWAQMFIAGSIYKDVSFFTELEMGTGGYKMAWFYFNFTNLLNTRWANLQIGRVTPLEYASYPNRLPTLPAIKSEVMLKKSSYGVGAESQDVSSVRYGFNFYGFNDWFQYYVGSSPGVSATSVDQFVDYWGGIILKMPDAMSKDFAGSTFTMHYYSGTDTKGTGTATQIENKYTRISPQFNLRWKDKLDLQFGYVIGNEDNVTLVTTNPVEFKYNGFGLTAGYFLTNDWMFAVHYDKYASDEINGVKKYDYERIIPTFTYIMNENIRLTLYQEFISKDKETTDKATPKSNKTYLNMRVMF